MQSTCAAMRVATGASTRHAGLVGGDAVLMDATRLSNTFTSQPQNRNMHGRIFGGFLMRRAYELAFSTAHLFCGSRPRFVQVDRVRL
jgi:acyl-coenzyme A thioesterase 9